MESLDRLIGSDDSVWLGTLPSYQGDLLRNFAQGRSPEEAADLWLSNSTIHTAPFSSGQTMDLYREKVWDEIEKLLCGDPAYDKERQELLANDNVTPQAIIATVIGAIAQSLHINVAFAAPLVALGLITAGRMNLNAWCAARKELRQQEKDSKG